MGTKKALLLGIVFGIFFGIIFFWLNGGLGEDMLPYIQLMHPFIFLMKFPYSQIFYGLLFLCIIVFLFFSFYTALIFLLFYSIYKNLKGGQESSNALVIILKAAALLAIFGLFSFPYFAVKEAKCFENADCIISKATKDDSVCNKASPYMHFPIHSQKYSVNQLNDFRGPAGCYANLAIIKNEDSFCDKLATGNEKGFCYLFLSNARSDINVCTKVKNYLRLPFDPPVDKWGEYYCVKNIAVYSKDVLKCDLIVGNPLKELCKSIITNNYSYCGKMIIDGSLFNRDSQDECWSYSGLEIIYEPGRGPIFKNGNPDNEKFQEICSQTINETERNECLKCGDHADESLMETCILFLGRNSGNPHYCRFIATEPFKDQCYWNVVEKIHDNSLCDNIKNPTIKGYCLIT